MIASWFAGLFALATGQGPVLTIDEAVRIASENGFGVRIARSGVDKSRELVRQARGGFGPRVTLDGAYTRFDRGPQFGAGPEGPILGAIDSKQVQLALNVPIDVTGLNRRSVEAAQVAETGARRLLDAELNTLRANVRSAYVEVLRADALVRVASEEVTQVKERLELVRKRFEVGQVARFDVLRVEAELTRSESNLSNAKNGARLTRHALNNLLARPIETPFDPQDLSILPKPTASGDALVQLALRRRPEMLGAAARVKAFALVGESERRGTLPSLSVSAIHSRTIDPFPFQREFSTTGVAQVVFPLFDSGVTRARVGAAREDERQAELQLEQIALAVALDVRQSILLLDNAESRIASATKRVEQEAEALRIATLRYDEGAGILLDVTTAQLALTAAKTELASARYDYLAAYATLQRATATDDLQSLPDPEEKP
jgi:outer membrane protein TolC